MTFADLDISDLFVPVVWDEECALHEQSRRALDGIVLRRDICGAHVAQHWCRTYLGDRRDYYAVPEQRVQRVREVTKPHLMTMSTGDSSASLKIARADVGRDWSASRIAACNRELS